MARGTVVLGAMDDIDFLHPVKVGQIAILRAQVEYVGRARRSRSACASGAKT